MRFKRRILGGCQREMAGIYRDDNGIDAFFGISSAVDPRGTDGQGPCRCLVPKSLISHAAFDPHRRLKPDEMLLRGRPVVQAAVEPQADHGDSAFAGRSPVDQYCWRGAILLRQVKVASSHRCAPLVSFTLSTFPAHRRVTARLAVGAGNRRGLRTDGVCKNSTAADLRAVRSEERRVGKECRSRWSPDH